MILTAHYNEHFGLAKFGEGAEAAALDVTFAQCDALQQLPRLVFALLRSPLLCQPEAVSREGEREVSHHTAPLRGGEQRGRARGGTPHGSPTRR